MKITHKTTYTPENYYVDTNGITSNCNTIIFDNYGEDDAEVFINDTNNTLSGWRFYLKAGVAIRLGGLKDSICQDTFNIRFLGAGAAKGINVIRETFEILT